MASAVGGGGVFLARLDIPGDTPVPSRRPCTARSGHTGLKKDKICSTLERIKGGLWGPCSGFPTAKTLPYYVEKKRWNRHRPAPTWDTESGVLLKSLLL